jgi:DNA-binding cell septation regulator SpoVG
MMVMLYFPVAKEGKAYANGMLSQKCQSMLSSEQHQININRGHDETFSASPLSMSVSKPYMDIIHPSDSFVRDAMQERVRKNYRRKVQK